MAESALVCANHPDRETSLRCNKCGKLICSQCAVRTPVGYRCKECVRGQQKIFETAVGLDYAVAVILAAIGVAVAVGVLNFIGFWGLLVAPIAGGGLAEIIRWAVRRRRGRR
ncbi:MAG: B-box zinc finger protein, partial [Anaerolineales bacterium]